MLNRSAPEDVQSRLNREMWRMRLGGWKGVAGSLLVVLLVALFVIRVPVQTEFNFAQVTGSMAHMTEDGVRQQIGILIDGQSRSAGTRAKLVHPAVGEMVCIRQTTYWPSGQVTLALTDDRFCK